MAEKVSSKILQTNHLVRLGNTGLKVSRISFGNWLNSNSSESTERMVILVKKAWDLGINFFDSAEVYGNG